MIGAAPFACGAVTSRSAAFSGATLAAPVRRVVAMRNSTII